MTNNDVWALERRFWLEGPSVYDDLLDPACLMAFPGTGLLRSVEVLDSLENAPRWSSVTMTGRAVSRAAQGVIVLGYIAEGLRQGAKPYKCFCTSTYLSNGGAWKLVQHQQTSVI